jgi:hypothetical protein
MPAPDERSDARNTARRTRTSVLLLGISTVVVMSVVSGCGGKGVNDPANELPSGYVDTPADGAQVKMDATFSGWAVDDRGVAGIRIYVDGRLAGIGRLTGDRPDVSKALPRYANGTHKHGWTIPVGFDAPGPRRVIVQAVDTDGATRDIAVLNVTVSDR